MSVDIEKELTRIKNSPYGSVVKDSIYSALKKLSIAPSGGMIPVHAGSFGITNDVSEFKIVHSEFVFPDDCPFVCDYDKFVYKIINPVLTDRTYHKDTAEYTIGAIATYDNGYSAPLFISPVSETAIRFRFTYSGTTYVSETKGTVEYAGLTWYYSNGAGAMPNYPTDSSGALLSYPNVVRYETPSDIISVLEWAHAAQNLEVQ